MACAAVLPSAAMAAEAAPSPPAQFSPITMFLNADIVVKGVMAGLFFASILVWTILAVKVFELRRLRKRAEASNVKLKTAPSLAQAFLQQDKFESIGAAMLRAARNEYALTPQHSPHYANLKDRISILLGRIEAGTARRAGAGISFLATVGATAPFVGLFGTVWGIMNSFVGIANAQTTNLAVVAPGIAEALLATAVGLFAAIPAAVFYNALQRNLGRYKLALSDMHAFIIVLVLRGETNASLAERKILEVKD